MEQRGGLLVHAGTVTPVAFACATLPRKLVKRRTGARQRQRAVTQAEFAAYTGADGRRIPKVTEGRIIGPLVLVIQLCGMQIKTWPPSDFVLVVWWGIAWRCAAGTAVVGAAGALLAAMAAGGWSKQVPVMASAVAAVYGIPITLWAVGSVLARHGITGPAKP